MFDANSLDRATTHDGTGAKRFRFVAFPGFFKRRASVRRDRPMQIIIWVGPLSESVAPFLFFSTDLIEVLASQKRRTTDWTLRERVPVSFANFWVVLVVGPENFGIDV